MNGKPQDNERNARSRFKLVSFLTEYDASLFGREVARGWPPNMGRLPLLLEAAEVAYKHVCDGKGWHEALALAFTCEGLYFHLPPVRRFVKWLEKEQLCQETRLECGVRHP